MNHALKAEFPADLSTGSTAQTAPCLSARWVSDVSELESISGQWSELANDATWKNPMLMPGMLIPAFMYLNDSNARCLIIEDNSDSDDVRLFGLLPLIDQKIYGIPIKTAAIWKHDYCFDGTPLIRDGFEKEVMEEIVTFLNSENYRLLKLTPVVIEEQLQQSIDENLHRLGASSYTLDEFERAAFMPTSDSKQYVLENLSKKFRQKSQRLARRLAEEGEVVYEQANEHSDFSQLAHQFLDLEQSGWKGKNGTALACDPSRKKFYLDCIERLSPLGQCRFLTLKLNDKPIAMISCISCGSRIQAFKTAFDESYASFSPGVAIEIHNLELMHAESITFADSCAASSESAMNRIWGQKVKIQSVVLALRSGLPTIVVNSLPLLKKMNTYRSRWF